MKEHMETPLTLSDITLDVKKSTIDEGKSFGYFSERASSVIVMTFVAMAVFFILGLQIHWLMFIVCFLSLIVGISYAFWLTDKPPNFIDDSLEDLQRAGLGGSRFTLGIYQHPQRGLAKKLHKLLNS